VFLTTVRIVALGLISAALGHGGIQPSPPLLVAGPLLHAHNAYPEDGRWRDRIDRALATGATPIVIEQDVALSRQGGSAKTVVSHDDELTGSEPTLEAYFFERIRPLMERALAERHAERWPLVVLHLDFKTNEREHHRAVWDLLGRYDAWLTTARVATEASAIRPLDRGPLLVLTENGTNQEKDFLEWSVAGGALRLFGSVPPPTLRSSDDPAERARILRRAAPHELIPVSANNYRRWANFSWGVIEEGGPANAGDWTDEDRLRLESVVNHAHRQGLLIRFYTLNGHDAAANRGWTASYNFGSLDAARLRWRAAIAARADLIATDQYEELAALLNTR
jgi:glycerophosphoryl diester phosphodiesterase